MSDATETTTEPVASPTYEQPGKKRLVRFRMRRAWRNHTGNQEVLPLRIYRPSRLREVREIIRQAESDGVTVRAVGSHHSWSDAALTTGYLIETHEMHDVRLIDSVCDGVDITRLIKVEAGMKIRELNDVLASRGLGLQNMGGYDEQTVGGVLGTSTHGSGITLGPICDYAVSIDLVGAGGQCYRVEPAGGITDPERFAAEHPGWQLKQDDDWFQAVQVSMGCFGVLFSVVLEVRDAYWLTEKRWLSDWTTVRGQLATNDVLEDNRHFEVYFNPHPTKAGGGHTCLITTRNICPSPPNDKPKNKRQRQFLTQIGGNIPVFAWVLRQIFSRWPQWTPWLIDIGLKGLVDDEYSSESFRVLNIGSENRLPAISSEIAVPVDAAGTHLKAVDEVLRVAALWRAQGNVYHSSPIALRFVRRSDAFLSMMSSNEITVMIELILFYPTTGGLELLAAYEEVLSPLGGRPHWGQVNSLGGNRAALTAMYPQLDEWISVHSIVNSSGVFDGPLSKRIGITSRGVLP